MTGVTEAVRAARFPRASQEAKGITPRIIHPSTEGGGIDTSAFHRRHPCPSSPGLLLLIHHHIREGPTTKVEKMLSECQGQSMSYSFLLVPRVRISTLIHLSTCSDGPLQLAGAECSDIRFQSDLLPGVKVGCQLFSPGVASSALTFFFSSFIEIELTYDTTHM